MDVHRRALSVALLVVLTALPALAAFCALTCRPSSAIAAAEHHATPAGHDHTASHDAPAGEPPDARLGEVSPHDCVAHQSARMTVGTAPGRADELPAPSALTARVDLDAPRSSTTLDPALRQNIPRGRAPSSASPLALRI